MEGTPCMPGTAQPVCAVARVFGMLMLCKRCAGGGRQRAVQPGAAPAAAVCRLQSGAHQRGCSDAAAGRGCPRGWQVTMRSHSSCLDSLLKAKCIFCAQVEDPLKGTLVHGSLRSRWLCNVKSGGKVLMQLW